ncbi:unnamed protein product [Protopolystoma xenopodis]|uniref:Uncharacterized protein n=1 Tax=Protopolystoma xenopodis TaxID=117903 RepID=A0A448WP73_9PLAT|nr:unnamed protein product [Protopolystoma xenopodis]
MLLEREIEEHQELVSRGSKLGNRLALLVSRDAASKVRESVSETTGRFLSISNFAKSRLIDLERAIQQAPEVICFFGIPSNSFSICI